MNFEELKQQLTEISTNAEDFKAEMQSILDEHGPFRLLSVQAGNILAVLEKYIDENGPSMEKDMKTFIMMLMGLTMNHKMLVDILEENSN